MNQLSTLLNTPDVMLRRFVHEPGVPHVDPEHEVSRFDSVSFVEGGGFDVHTNGGQWQLDPGAMFVTTRGMSYRCVHHDEVPSDECLSIAVTEQATEDLRSAGMPALRPPLFRLDGRSRFLRRRLDRCGAGEEVRLDLIAAELFMAVAGGDQRQDGHHSAQVMRGIERALDLIEAEYARPLALRELAAAAAMSPYHFSRVFRNLTGIPPHRYLAGVRLRHAAEMLRHGASVTHACYATGFGSLGHFITVFGLRFGVSPSAVARGARLPVHRVAPAIPLFSRLS
jgi:AraC-like DNA-binding protein